MKWCFDIVPAAAAALVEAAAAAAAARLAWLLGWKGVLGWGYMGEGSGPVWEDKIGAGNVPELLGDFFLDRLHKGQDFALATETPIKLI